MKRSLWSRVSAVARDRGYRLLTSPAVVGLTDRPLRMISGDKFKSGRCVIDVGNPAVTPWVDR